MMNVFCYGPLGQPEIMSALTGRTVQGNPVFLDGFEFGTISPDALPGAYPAEGGRISGALYSGLTDQDFKVLNNFHDSYFEYTDNLTVTPRIGGPSPAASWIIPDRHKDIMSRKAWSLEAFRRTDLPRFVAACREYRRDVMTKGMRDPFTFAFTQG